MNVSPAQSGNVKIDQNIPTDYPFTQNINTGSSVSLQAIPAAGYEFAGWSGSLTNKDNPATIVIDCTKTVTASFIKKDSFVLTMEVKGGGIVDPAVGIHGYVQGTVVNITATPDWGYQFDGWTGPVADAKAASTTVTISSGKTVTANFSAITYTLTLAVKGSGSVSPSLGDHTSIYGSIVSITATPNAGYQFVGWTGSVADANSPTTTVTVTSNMTVTANFARILSLNLEVNGAGSVSMPVGIHMFAEGTVVNITATPDTGYKFVNWTGNVADAKSASTTVTIDSNKTITVNFSKLGLTPLLLGVIIGGGAVVVVVVAWLLTRKQKSQT